MYPPRQTWIGTKKQNIRLMKVTHDKSSRNIDTPKKSKV